MPDSVLSIFEKFMRAQILALGAVITSAVGTRVVNIAPTRSGTFPSCVFTLVPLDDSFGQAQATIMTRLQVDVKFITKGAPTDATEAAVEAVFQHFKMVKAVVFNGFRISTRHKRPINFREPGATAEEFFYHRGGTFQAWLATAL